MQPSNNNKKNDKLGFWSIYWRMTAVTVLLVLAVLTMYITPSFIINRFSPSFSNSLESSVISWFSIIATLVLAAMALIAVYGYFNTKSVSDKMKELDAWHDNLEKIEKKANRLNTLITQLETFQEQVRNFPLPDSLDVPAEKQRRELQEIAKQAKWLKAADFPTVKRQSFIVGLHYYSEGKYEDAIREFENYILSK